MSLPKFSAPASTGALAGNSQLYQEASAKRFNALKNKKIKISYTRFSYIIISW